MIKDKRIYLIEWYDSYSLGDGWLSVRSLKKPKKMVCVSVGYILKETKDVILIASHITDIREKKCLGTTRGILIIPKGTIIKKKRLEEK